MNHCMTVRADWPQISDRVDFVGLANFRKVSRVMNMYVTLALFAIGLPKIEVANEATGTIMLNTTSSCFGISLVGIDKNLPHSSLI